MALGRGSERILGNLDIIFVKDYFGGCLEDWDTMRKRYLKLGRLNLVWNWVILKELNLLVILAYLSPRIQMGIGKLALISFLNTHEDIMLEL